ncbi:histidine kinase [Paenibacillus sambharensis]|uniref:Histidine kinase n=1 Tax=Paenibacillus sambharensis TaxID=1803190 RepID=A0A2W1LQJ5_9BACL|nr:histidine kinase [Paenibacillus sambharensis]PZD96784.1 histidine kinase [Paenibacillus sambharensis]
MQDFKQRSPEQLLQSIVKLQMGRLKIYIGALTGSGKTYHMLQEGQELKRLGIDVVTCAVSTMQRPETKAQLSGLERIPSIRWHNEDGEQKDLDVEAILKRDPDVVLTDRLAHKNRRGAPRPTRLEDIRFLLHHGISVIATINVYELQGVTELARRLVGIEAANTVPADTLALADEVQLIDVTPETLLQRLEEGLLLTEDVQPLFNPGDISVLRELTLRLVAEDVNGSLEKHREEQGLVGSAGIAEHILVSVQYHWNGSIYIRRGQQVAKRLGGDLSVVTFTNPKQRLSQEHEEFRRSMLKLAKKIGAAFHERPLVSRRRLPGTLVDFALRHNITRIVLGHSKQTRWQEWLQGSIVHDILKQTRNVDVFIVADRAAAYGERILQAKIKGRQDLNDENAYHRLNSRQVGRKIEEIKQGKFRVYIGAAPGVGKTYTMLREGNILLKKGVDVILGYVETHGRKDTAAQIGDLERVPLAFIPYKGTQLQEMDTEAILARNPEVVLVDELAHTNVPGSLLSKRYEDVTRLLQAGISVISTMNVQHLESLNDAVEQLTGVRVRETVPDSILRMADEVALIDVAPQALQQRMREGKIYALEKVEQALSHFFKTGNLIALRELALREIADDVDERLESWQRSSSLRGPWRREEAIFVSVTLSDHAERLIRRGFRIAHRLKAQWHVCYVHVGEAMTIKQKERAEILEKLTVRLGGHFKLAYCQTSRRLHEAIIQQANVHHSTQMVVGQPDRSLLEQLTKGALIKKLLRAGRHMDVLVVSKFSIQPAGARGRN